MSSCWTSKYAILRDLSIVQGCVPGDIEGTVGVGEKPPTPDLIEETEEEFYRKYTGGDDGSVLMPDFQPIKAFLDMINDGSSSGDEELAEEFTEQVLDNKNKLNPPCTEFMTKNSPAGDNNIDTRSVRNNVIYNNNISKNPSPINQSPLNVKNVGNVKLKPRKKRNIAFESIFEMGANEKNNYTISDAPAPTVTPIIKKDKKVSPVKKMSPFLLDGPMFKVKEGVRNEKTTPKTVNYVEKPVMPAIKQYVPTKQVDEYYKKYVERSKLAKQTKEDIWERAERLMKEIDLKKKMEAEQKAKYLETENVNTNENGEDTDDVTTHNIANIEIINNNNSLEDSSAVSETASASFIDTEQSESDTKSSEDDVDAPTTSIINDIDSTAFTSTISDVDVTPSTSTMSDISDVSSSKIVADMSVACSSSGSDSPPLYSNESEVEVTKLESFPREAYLGIHRHRLNRECLVCQMLCNKRDNRNTTDDKKKTEEEDVSCQAENWRIRDVE